MPVDVLTGFLDPDGQALTWRWRILTAPPSSHAALNGVNDPDAEIWADYAGDYLMSLEVKDGFASTTKQFVVTAVGDHIPAPHHGGCGCDLGGAASPSVVPAALLALLCAAAIRRRRFSC